MRCAGVVKYYVNGQVVATSPGGATLDGRFALYSNADAGPDVLMFNEGDGSGVYTHELLVNSLVWSDRTFSDAEMLARFQNSKKRPPCSDTLGMRLADLSQRPAHPHQGGRDM